MNAFASGQEALAAGSKRYFTGTPCKNGHVCERNAKYRTCVECHRVASAKRQRPTTINGKTPSEYHRLWYAQNAQKARDSSRAWRLRNPEKTRAQLIKWEKQNKEKRLKISRRRSATKRDEIRAKGREWSRRHPARLLAKSAFRKAQKRKATPAWVDRKALTKIYEDCPKGMHVDHVVPLRNELVCGLHVPWNLQYLTPAENLLKGNRL